MPANWTPNYKRFFVTTLSYSLGFCWPSENLPVNKELKKWASNFYQRITKTPFCCTWKPTRNSSIGRNNKGFSPFQLSLSVSSVFIWQFHRSHIPDKASWPLSMIGLFYDLVSGMDMNVCLITKKIAFSLWSTADADTSTIIS